MHPLDGPRLRLRMAKDDFEALDSTMRTFIRAYAHKIVAAEYDSQTRRHAMRMSIPVPPSEEWSVTVSNVIHQFRSALDNVVWQLALLNSSDALLLSLRGKAKPQFPIFLDGKAFARHGSPSTVRLRDEHREAIDLLQPYHAGDKASRDPLWWLHELNNADKHHVLVIARIAQLGFGYATGEWAHCQDPVEFFHPLPDIEDGTQIGWVCRCLVYPDMRVNVGQLSDIAFGKGCSAVERKPVGPVLGSIAKKVTDIVEGFAHSFD